MGHPRRVMAALIGLALAVPPGAEAVAVAAPSTPINDLATRSYLGFQGGLYPDGSNALPATHHAVGVGRARRVRPVDVDGVPKATGKIVLLSIGMSNTTQEFCARRSDGRCAPWSFSGQAAVDPQVDHANLVIVDGAAGGQTAGTWTSPNAENYDRVRTSGLAPLGLTENQVQVVWVKVANATPTVSLPASNADAYQLVTQQGAIARALRARYPNLQLVFFSSRIYAGYATTRLNPEPYAYESGFGVKWVIQAQINQMAGSPVDPRAGNLSYHSVAPWLAWGPYLWADGTTPRSDGLTWARSELANDGTHPAQPGEEKVGTLLLDFFKSSPQTVCWFLVGRTCA
ncbi:hypothetical protein [Micromonospora sp. CPCC 205561]|uniref:hypothetical protein n=1 Tax=Micromonospora sp. CPCC 205561 TaxID=3122407 RepID=UPI002FF22933